MGTIRKGDWDMGEYAEQTIVNFFGKNGRKGMLEPAYII